MNADTEFDPCFLRNTGVLLGHFALGLDRAARCVHRAGTLHQHAVAGSFDYTTAMRSDCRIDVCLTPRLEASARTSFVAAHQAAVASDIRRPYSRRLPLHPLLSQP